MKIKKLFLMLGVILFILVTTGCTSNSLEIKEGRYVCNGNEYYGEFELNIISEDEFINANGVNVFKVDYDGEYRYYSINAYIIPINKEEKVYLNFNNLEKEDLHKITFKKYYFVDQHGHMIDPNEQFINIMYITDDISVINSFYIKDN